MNHMLTVTVTRHCPDRPPMDSVVGFTEYNPAEPGVLAALAGLLDRLADEVSLIAVEAEEALS